MNEMEAREESKKERKGKKGHVQSELFDQSCLKLCLLSSEPLRFFCPN